MTVAFGKVTPDSVLKLAMRNSWRSEGGALGSGVSCAESGSARKTWAMTARRMNLRIFWRLRSGAGDRRALRQLEVKCAARILSSLCRHRDSSAARGERTEVH